VYNGKRHGIGTYTSATYHIVYYGEWYMGKRSGKGKMVFNEEGTSFYEGDWLDNKKYGWGVRRYPSGT
jgi:hypothetical protein